jgi:(1->4)-alpha-D-glucan 1-alpha-D-glucosylmutase
MLESAKERVIDSMLAAEFTVLTRALSRIAAGHFSTRDFTINRLRAALQLYAVEFPIYRTYVTAAGASPRDREIIEAAIERARARWRAPDPNIFDFLRDAITLDLASNPGYSAPRVRNFAMKLQQFTGPLMAKSLEDTAFYRYHRLLALNEVGGEPNASALPLEQFHRIMQRRAESAPAALTATATHDTKRGEDARARILALAEIPQDWAEAIRGWMQLNAPLAHGDDGRRGLSRNHEYMVYQALVGAWPERLEQSFVQRMQVYALKAAREGKQETSWTNPNTEYEQTLEDFVGAILDPARSAAFIESFARFAERTTLIGALNGLSQLALKCLLPGVPDFYQGTEFWDLSLVDPDNRRPVDFAARAQVLAGLPSDHEELAKNWRDGQVKIALMRDLLALRALYPMLFQNGSYQSIAVTGDHAEHVIAFARAWRNEHIVLAVGRNFAPLTDGGRHWPSGWSGAIALEPGAYYRSRLGAAEPIAPAELQLDVLFRTLPVAVLVRGNSRR